MKKILSGIFVLLSFQSFAQKSNFTLGLIMPEGNREFDDMQIKKLEGKLMSIINNSEVSQYGYSNDFVVYPIISIDEISSVQGGLEIITVAAIDLKLGIKQISTNRTFNLTSKKLKGSGKTEKLATTNALVNLKINDKDLVDFIVKGKENIYTYFNENCNQILNTAQNYFKTNSYEQAIALAQSIPETGNNCYQQAQNKALEYYKGYQSKLCTENISKAKGLIALKEYNNALTLLNMVDVNSNCYSQVEKLINEISTKINNADKMEMDLEVRRIDAIKEIAKAYYSSAARTIRYNVIIR